MGFPRQPVYYQRYLVALNVSRHVYTVKQNVQVVVPVVSRDAYSHFYVKIILFERWSTLLHGFALDAHIAHNGDGERDIHFR